MNFESLVPTATSIGGGFFVGIMLGYFIKKIIKILMFVAGGMVALLVYLGQQELISVDIEKLEASSILILNLLASPFDNITQIANATSLEIPLTGGLSAGFAIGLMKG